MRSYLAGLDRPGRASAGVAVGGCIAVLGAFVIQAEGGPIGPDDVPGVRTLLALALVVAGIGIAMTASPPRRRLAWLVAVLAGFGAAFAALAWVGTLIPGVFTIDTPPMSPGLVGLPLYITGCVVAMVLAVRVQRLRHVPSR